MSQTSPSLDEIVDEAPPHPIDIVRDILGEVGSLPRLMEIDYLAREPGLLDIMRGLAALPDGDRQVLRDYLARHSHKRLGLRQLPTGAVVLAFTDRTPLAETAQA
jgi:hypothetical protein